MDSSWAHDKTAAIKQLAGAMVEGGDHWSTIAEITQHLEEMCHPSESEPQDIPKWQKKLEQWQEFIARNRVLALSSGVPNASRYLQALGNAQRQLLELLEENTEFIVGNARGIDDLTHDEFGERKPYIDTQDQTTLDASLEDDSDRRQHVTSLRKLLGVVNQLMGVMESPDRGHGDKMEGRQ